MAVSKAYADWREVHGSAKRVARGASVAEPANPEEIIEILLRMRRKTKLPRPPTPGRSMSRPAYEAQHGADPADIEKVGAFADHFRLTVADVNAPERLLILKGRIADFEQAFRVELRRHRFDAGESYRGREGHISVPSEIADIVTGVFGLDDRPVVTRPLRQRAPVAEAGTHGGSQTDVPIRAFFPNELARLYNFPTDVDGTGQKIGMVELGGGYTDQALTAYFAQAGVANPPRYVTRPVHGGAANAPDPTDENQPDVEVLLDMEVAGTIAPGAELFMYFVSKDGSDKQVLLGISAAIHDAEADLSVLSLSFGAPEYDSTTMGNYPGASAYSQWQDAVNDLFATAGHLGITVCAASGDQASFCMRTDDRGFDGRAHVGFPASSPYALACGGTHIVAATAGDPAEEVWHPASGDGTGGGISRYFAVPDYQTGTVTEHAVNPAGGPGRGVPDVCANAAQESGYRVLVDGLWYPDAAAGRPPIGGTSASTPLWAGLVALMNQSLQTRLGFINPLLYKIGSPSSAFFDVTKGNNGDYQAKPGWDPCTGLGSPNGVALLAALKPLVSRPGAMPIRQMAAGALRSQADQSLFDMTPYGSGKDDSIADATESAAVTHHTVTIDGATIPYTAHAGHLVTTGVYNAHPAAKIFYVSFTADNPAESARPVTFFYNGGPGSSSVFLLLGSFGPRRIKTDMPHFTPPPPYELEDNPDSLLDRSDLVFINPVGTGYSSAIAPRKNRDFWGVDEDATSIKQFIKRYLTVFRRWNSPKFLFGESYGTPRTCVLSWLLHEDGVDLNGVVLQSSILDYGKVGNSVGILPTLAADAWYHKKTTVSPQPANLPSFMRCVEAFASYEYAAALATYPKIPGGVLPALSEIVGVSEDLLNEWKLNLAVDGGTLFLKSLLEKEGVEVGAYDGRVTGVDTGIAGSIDPNAGGNDPTITAVGGVYTAMWNVYLNDELQYTSIAPFVDLNDQAFANWNFAHIDPRGDQRGGDGLYTAGDLAAAMALNPYLKVFSANGYYDAVTPFFQTILNFQGMELDDEHARRNLTVRNYPSGHMIYLDGASRTAMKRDLARFYDSTRAERVGKARLSRSRATRRISSTPY